MNGRIAGFVLLLLARSLPAQELEDASRAEALRLMQAAAKEFEMRPTATPDTMLTVAESPALRFSNPVRELLSDGTTFFYFDGPRPIAAVSLSIRGQASTPRRVWAEVSLTAPVTLNCRRNGAEFWSPKDDLPGWKPAPEALVPGGTAASRLVQMREIARRFEVEVLRKEVWTMSRLLTQPVVRFADPRTHTVDGAAFVFAEATDPEVLLLFDARTEADSDVPRWYYLLAKMSSPPTRVRFDGREIWTTEGFWKAPNPTGSYREAIVDDYDSLKGRFPDGAGSPK